MNWNGTCTDSPEVVNANTTGSDDPPFDLGYLAKLRKEMDKIPPVLMELRVSCDDSCPIVQAISSLPSKVPTGVLEQAGIFQGGIPVKKDELIPRGRAIMKFSDGSGRLLIEDRHTGMFITIGDGVKFVKEYIELLTKVKEGVIWKN